MSDPKYAKSLKQAKIFPDAYVVMEGDWGGVCYLTCPVSMISCDESTLRSLLRDLTEISGDEADGSDLWYGRYLIGDYVASGSVGHTGVATSELWLDKWLEEFGHYDRIKQVITGERPSLGLTNEELVRIQEIRKERRRRLETEIAKRTKQRDGQTGASG